MDRYISMDVYVDKNKNVSHHILKLLNKICEEPMTEETESTIFKELCGNKGFGQFSKKHICISVEQKIGDDKIEIYNSPRLPDGSYGTEKGEISEQYSIKYVSEKKDELIQEYFEKAYGDAERYLAAIGSKLY